MKSVNFYEFEELKKLIKLAETIPGLECNYPINVEMYESFEFKYREDNMEYLLYVTPIFDKNQVIHYMLFDKVSLFCKDLLEFGKFEKFPFYDYFEVEGTMFLPKKVTYDGVTNAILNIDMNEAYDYTKKFWTKVFL
jgi:hypothetical protein